MRVVIESIEGEYRRCKKMAEAAFCQLTEAQLAQVAGSTSNSVATIAWHIAGNLRSRFTDFLETDGEKPWRDRETEFIPRRVTHSELLAFWEQGWQAMSNATAGLHDRDLERTVTIRNQRLPVVEALHRSLAHASSHVGQIVFLAKALRGGEWNVLSIPPGQSEEFNRNPVLGTPQNST